MDSFELNKIVASILLIALLFIGIGKISDLIDQPLHLGITESGSLKTGTVKSSIGLGILLMQGIGDTIRISLASDPIDEVKVGWEMLKSLKLRSRGVKIVACPSCSRQNFQVIKTVNKLETELSEIKEEVTLAVIGCYVNGPGESKVADVGVTGASPQHLIYSKGKPAYKVETKDLEKALVKEVMKIAENKRNTIFFRFFFSWSTASIAFGLRTTPLCITPHKSITNVS